MVANQIHTDLFDYVVLGAGIVGAMCAYELGRHTKSRIAVVEKNSMASGASKWSLGLRSAKVFDPQLISICKMSFDYFEELKKSIPALPDAAVPIHYLLCDTMAKPYFIKDPTLVVNTSSALERYRLQISADDLENQHIYSSTAFIGNVAGITRELLSVFESEEDHLVLEHQQVTNVVKVDSDYRIEIDNSPPLRAKTVVVCAGAYAKFISAPGPSPKVRTKKIVSFKFRLNQHVKPGVFYLEKDKGFLMFKEAGSEGYLSISSEDWDVEPPFDRLALFPTEMDLAHLLMEKYFGKNRYRIIDTGIHCDSYANDGLPQLCSIQEGLYYATGTSGSGYKYAPYLAQQLHQTIVENINF